MSRRSTVECWSWTLSRWVVADRCRLAAIVGMGGLGKTALAARLARELAPDFEAVYWRSVRNAPPCAEWLAGPEEQRPA